VYRSGLAEAMPDGLRMPVVHAIDDEPDLVTLWLEDVDDASVWDRNRYVRAATALGRLGARWPADSAARRLGMGHREISTLFFGKVLHNDLVIQADDGFWADPAVADAVDDRYRADLFRLAELVPGMLAALDALPRGMCHGDAAPGNLLDPGDGSTVAIDWSYGNVEALGSDLAQLLVGRVDEADDLEAEALAPAIIDAYLDGVGDASDRDAVTRAFTTHLAVRSVFSALLVDEPGLDESARAERLERRARLARFGLDAALRCGRAGR
jgi:tRNA A-37 threonylcarbamoyl transferase component Bud32